MANSRRPHKRAKQGGKRIIPLRQRALRAQPRGALVPAFKPIDLS